MSKRVCFYGECMPIPGVVVRDEIKVIGGESMTTAERYPNFARLTALLNQQKHPRCTLRALISILEREGGVEHDRH